MWVVTHLYHPQMRTDGPTFIWLPWLCLYWTWWCHGQVHLRERSEKAVLWQLLYRCAYWIEKLPAFPECGASSKYASIPGKSIIVSLLVLNSYSTHFEDVPVILPMVFLVWASASSLTLSKRTMQHKHSYLSRPPSGVELAIVTRTNGNLIWRIPICRG